MITCGRCASTSTEAGTVEAFTVVGEGVWHLCHECLGYFINFMANQEEPMGLFTDQVISVLYADDIDIAEHHALCSCYDCVVDPDEYRKFELENRDDITAERRSA